MFSTTHAACRVLSVETGDTGAEVSDVRKDRKAGTALKIWSMACLVDFRQLAVT